MGVARRTVSLALAASILLAGCSGTPGDVTTAVDSIYAHAEGIQPENEERQQLRDIAVIDWAIERGLEEPFSHSDLQRAYETEMTHAQAGVPAAPQSYGARAMTFWNFYVERVEGMMQAIRAGIRQELTMDEVRVYYEDNQNQFAKQDVIRIEVAEWADGRALSSSEVTIDEHSVRTMQERDDDVIAAALTLAPGERTTVERGEGRFAQLECLSRTDGGVEPFDEVIQAASSQLATERFHTQLQRRLAALQ